MERGLYRGTQTRGDGSWGPPDVSFQLTSDWSTTEPQWLKVLGGQFRATTNQPRIVVSASGRTTGVQHAPFSLMVGSGIPAPLNDPADPSWYKAGVEPFWDLGSIAGEYGTGPITREVFPTTVRKGELVQVEVRTGIVGYGYTVSGLGSGNVTVLVTPNNQKMYALTADNRVVPILTGRSLENTVNTTVAGELIPAVPYTFALPFSGAFKSDSTRGYITDFTGGAVVVFDTVTDRVISTVTGMGTPIGAAVNGDDTLLYVANYAGGAGSIKEINLSTHAVTARSLAATTVLPAYVALSPDETKLAVACQGGGGVTNRLYVYNVPAWTLAATCVIGGADALNGKIAWEGNNVVWVPIPSHNAVYRCQVDTQTVSYNIPFTGAQAVKVSKSGTGISLFVVSPTNSSRAAYYVLPSNSTTAPTFYDGGSEANFISIDLSTDDFIYEGTTAGQIKVYQGGTVFFSASNQPFWGDHCRIDIWGGEAA